MSQLINDTVLQNLCKYFSQTAISTLLLFLILFVNFDLNLNNSQSFNIIFGSFSTISSFLSHAAAAYEACIIVYCCSFN